MRRDEAPCRVNNRGSMFEAAEKRRRAGCLTPTAPLFAERQPHRFSRIGVTWVQGETFPLEMRPLIHPLPPFDVGFADELIQKEVRREDSSAIIRQASQRLSKILEQQLASLEVALQDQMQCAYRIGNMRSQPIPDLCLGLNYR